jgi:hypothetical protein
MTATWVDGGYLLGTVEGTFRSSVASGAQGGVCFGVSLILGGLFFACCMRALEFSARRSVQVRFGGAGGHPDAGADGRKSGASPRRHRSTGVMHAARHGHPALCWSSQYDIGGM